MSEYVFRYASGYGSDMGALMDGGRVTVGDYFASESTDHYGTLHEEIVRCRDCLSWHRGKCFKHVYTVIDECDNEYEEGSFSMDANGFCSLGELRGDA